jgi:hypothetical protein
MFIDMSSLRIIYVSTESFRIFNAICADEKKAPPKTFKEKQVIFPTRTPAFFLAAALGIINGKTKTNKKERQLTRMRAFNSR